MGWRLGVDIGGTFIDFCALDEETRAVRTLKVLTTPDEPGRELAEGIDLLAREHGVAPGRITAFVHGTTVGVNTILQRKGARLALVTNAGFEDVIELARLGMVEMYSLFCSRPEQLIPRDMVFGIAGRRLADGREEAPPDLGALPGIVAAARAREAEGIVVSFLHAWRDAGHETAVREAISHLAPDLFVFSGAEVWPVIREYERTTTAILNGYVHPRVSAYLTGLERTLDGRGVPAAPLLTKSNGGLMNARDGKRACVNMLLSGTASGVIGAAWIARQAGVANVLTLDIGGTSTDLALVIGGEPQFGTGEAIGDFPLPIPSVSVSSIGIGGGSIATADALGVLKVGPESAGSLPGPACYGRGGTEPTVTDAMAVCGWLGHAPLAYGSLTMDAGRARAAVAGLAARLGRGVEDTAEAILRVAVSEIFVEVEKLSTRYGVDLRDFTLMPFGGGGPMLGCFLARELGLSDVLAPRRPGLVSALGGLVADLKGDFIRTVFAPCAPETAPALRAAVAALSAEGQDWLRRDQGFAGPILETFSADMRYAGQSFEIETPVERGWIERGDMAAMAETFHRRHAAVYDFHDPDGTVEIVNLRLVVAGAGSAVEIAPARPDPSPARPDRLVTLRLDGAAREAPLHLRADIAAGHRLAGPAVVVQEDTTLAIPPGFDAVADEHLNLRLTLREDA